MTGKLPPTASVALPQGGDKLHAPAAERNAAALSALLQTMAPAQGRALEIASGTGQHIVHFARALPGLHWQPTDIEAIRLRSIDAHVAEAGLENVAPAAHLNAADAGWPQAHPAYDLVVLVNLLHLIPANVAQTILTRTCQALTPGGAFLLYGPFRRDGVLTSEGDLRFDAELREADPAIGYKDTRDISDWLRGAGFGKVELHEMPANNLAFTAQRNN